jgi:hypothetical protein
LIGVGKGQRLETFRKRTRKRTGLEEGNKKLGIGLKVITDSSISEGLENTRTTIMTERKRQKTKGKILDSHRDIGIGVKKCKKNYKSKREDLEEEDQK